MIRVLVYLGEEDNQQLAELRISWMEHLPLGWARYHAEIAVNTGEEIHILTRTFEHEREKKNVLSMIETLILNLEEDELLLKGKMDSHSQANPHWKQIGQILRGLVKDENE